MKTKTHNQNTQQGAREMMDLRNLNVDEIRSCEGNRVKLTLQGFFVSTSSFNGHVKKFQDVIELLNNVEMGVLY